MKKKLIRLAPLLVIALLMACGQPPDDPQDPPLTAPELPDTIVDQPNPIASTPRSDTLIPLQFNRELLPPSVSWEGKIADSAHWMDKNGENWLIISEKWKGMVADEGFTSNVYARCFNYAHDTLGLYWEIKEFNQNLFEAPEYSTGTLEILDLDEDGYAESCFIYLIESDGADPCGVKLILHVKGKKYAIRGQLAGMDYDMGDVEEKNIDPVYKEIAPLFRDFASQKWDAFEDDFYEGWVNPDK